ncbi:polysaccharide biosynthesis/export family protein [Rhodoferax sp. UBA5149]|uniref:polysaccharide biosynthesis/export family protein n=1 Tax=Rhodoferax sp. UBA5149 TaxID=1947379 RepID=UPI0025D71C79|nr:SLBB domain-containing protein [Rhodoferax sp. UBA5149]
MLKSPLKSFCLRAMQAALALSLSAGLQAQTAATAFGGAAAAPASAVTTDAAAPAAATPAAARASALQQSIQQQAAAQEATKAGADAPGPEAARARPPARVSGPNQFQRFVQETTGRLLPMYGRDLFDTPQAYAADSALPAPADYVLGAGDEVRLQVWGPVDFNTSLTIDRNGQVNIPKVGVVTLAGVAVRDLEATLRSHLGKVFTNFQANATMGRLRGIQVYVVGQARQPGTFQLSSLSTLVNALFASGGPSANGSMRNIELKRAGKTVSTLDLYDFIARGDKSHDLPLMSGDVIVIPPVGPRVAVTGAFDQAAIYELKTGATSVADILSLGGGVPALATTQKALLERITRESNPPRQVQEIVLNEQGLRQPLHDGDVLTLLGISPAFANAVTLQGTVAAPLRYRWFEGMKILDLIPERDALITGDYYKRKNLLVQNTDVAREAGSNVATRIRGLSDQINWDYAVIERMDRNKLSNELIPFNLGKAVLQRDPAYNLPLQAGDVVTILSQNDLRLPQDRQSRLVRVEGEVAAPGVYQTLPGETLPQLLRRIGGLTPQAYVFGTELNRESVRTRQQENLDTLIHKLEAQSQAQTSSFIANKGADNAAQAQLLQQQQALQLKSQIDRLKSFKSNGRLALELDPQAQTLAALPALPLEDGDHILVPAVPGFVSAFGSVNNENVFIYKSGKTVADVLKSAGLTEDAEPDQAFVLRADGSIVARRDHSGLFGGGFESIQVMPGDTVVVPAQIDRESRYNMVTRAFKDWTQILSNFGLGVAAINSISKL